MKQKSINAFFSGGKAAQSKECDNTGKVPAPAKKSVTPAKKSPSKAPQPASPLAKKPEETKPEPQPLAAPATAPADAEVGYARGVGIVRGQLQRPESGGHYSTWAGLGCLVSPAPCYAYTHE